MVAAVRGVLYDHSGADGMSSAAAGPGRAEPETISELIAGKNTCVVNVVASWCPDCTVRQKPHLVTFAQHLQQAGIDVFEVNVQDQQRVYLSSAHQQMTEEFGGHGFPRTVLICDGQIVDSDNVEVMTLEGLEKLAIRFIKRVALKGLP